MRSLPRSLRLYLRHLRVEEEDEKEMEEEEG